jgi:hypothetical protein
MTSLIQARVDTFADTAEYGERIARTLVPGSGPVPKACLITVEDEKICIYTLNANDPAVDLLVKTKIVERVY